MPRKSISIPKVTSESEEGYWYATPQGRRQSQREFARALKDGTLIRAAGSKIAKRDLPSLGISRDKYGPSLYDPIRTCRAAEQVDELG